MTRLASLRVKMYTWHTEQKEHNGYYRPAVALGQTVWVIHDEERNTFFCYAYLNEKTAESVLKTMKEQWGDYDPRLNDFNFRPRPAYITSYQAG